MLQNDTKFGTGIATLYIPVIIKTMKYNYNQLSVSVSSILLPSKTLSMAHFCNLWSLSFRNPQYMMQWLKSLCFLASH